MSKLKRFTTFGGQDPFKNFARLNEHESYDAWNLQHLAIEVIWREHFFMDMLESFKLLRSLHVLFRKDIIFYFFIQALRPHGSSLRSLAMSFRTSHDDETDPVDQSDFDEMCRTCSNVYFLGLHVNACDLHPGNWDSHPVPFRARLSSLKQMRGLRLIHIRMSRYKDPTSHRSRMYIMQDLRSRCSAIFQYMFVQKACPSLKAIVVGYNVYPDLEPGICCTQHCFIRDYEMEAGKTWAVAVPVHAARLRDLLPDCHLLDYDPECESLAYLPGRIHF
jgi:hypothetical protein